MKDHGYSKILRLRNNTDLDELRDKAADITEWQSLVEKLGETTSSLLLLPIVGWLRFEHCTNGVPSLKLSEQHG